VRRAIALTENVYYAQHTGCATMKRFTCIGVNYRPSGSPIRRRLGWAVVYTCPATSTRRSRCSARCGALSSIGCNDDNAVCGSGAGACNLPLAFSCTAGTPIASARALWRGVRQPPDSRPHQLAANDTCDGAFWLSDNVYYSENTGTASDDTGMPCSRFGPSTRASGSLFPGADRYADRGHLPQRLRHEDRSVQRCL